METMTMFETGADFDPFHTPGVQPAAVEIPATKPARVRKAAQAAVPGLTVVSPDRKADKPATKGKKTETKAELPNYHNGMLFGPYVVAQKLQSALELVFDDCYIGRMAVAEYARVWKNSLGASNLLFALTRDMEGREKRHFNAIAMALKSLYGDGLGLDALEKAFSSCNDRLYVGAEDRAAFKDACEAFSATQTAEQRAECAACRFEFETLVYAPFKDDRDANARRQYAAISR